MNFNTFISFINRFFGRDESETSKNMAKERLRLVLVHDRLDISEQVMNALREDLLNVIGKYFGIDEQTLEVSLSREPSGMALVANIPIRRQKDTDIVLAEAKASSAAGQEGAEPKAAPKPKQGDEKPVEKLGPGKQGKPGENKQGNGKQASPKPQNTTPPAKTLPKNKNDKH